MIDLQQGIVGYATAHPIANVIARSAALAFAFRKRELPVVLVNLSGGAPGRAQAPSRPVVHPPAGWTDLVTELDAQPSDLLVTKQTWGAFHGTSLHEQLQARAVTQVIIAGVSTSAGVESTARAAHERGYHVVLATDAMTDMNADAHDNSVERIFPRLGETTTSDEILALL